jgi:hypothetical protein
MPDALAQLKRARFGENCWLGSFVEYWLKNVKIEKNLRWASRLSGWNPNARQGTGHGAGSPRWPVAGDGGKSSRSIRAAWWVNFEGRQGRGLTEIGWPRRRELGRRGSTAWVCKVGQNIHRGCRRFSQYRCGAQGGQGGVGSRPEIVADVEAPLRQKWIAVQEIWCDVPPLSKDG